MGKKKSKKSTQDKILITIFSVVITISILTVAGVFLLNSRFFLNKDTPDSGNGKLDEGFETPTEVREKYVNFLVAGIDYMEGSGRGKLTDVIMVVNFDIENKKVNILQIPRDTHIGTEYTKAGKINQIYARENGGIEGLARTINKNFAITIDHYVTINMDGFKKIVDKIGGVEVDVPKTISLEGVTINKGVQVLDGYKAEKFVRNRSYANADLGRLEMQKIFLEALLKKMLNLSATKVMNLAPTLITEVTTDLTLANMLGYYSKISGMTTQDFSFHLLPIQSGGKLHGESVLSIKKYEAADMLNEFFRSHMKSVAAEDLGIIELVKTYPKNQTE